VISVLVVNAGSSSLKLSVLGPADDVTAELTVPEWDGSPRHPDVIAFLRGQPGVGAVGHRVVHGGRRFPVCISRPLRPIVPLSGEPPFRGGMSHRDVVG
jgi:acetate kinase